MTASIIFYIQKSWWHFNGFVCFFVNSTKPLTLPVFHVLVCHAGERTAKVSGPGHPTSKKTGIGGNEGCGFFAQNSRWGQKGDHPDR
jgi:hypothetical protein